MTKYEIYKQLRDARQLTDTQVSEQSGVNRSTFSDWKNGRCEPKEKKLRKLCEFFGVPMSVFYPKTEEQPSYYFDEKTANLAQEMFGNQELMMLVDASKKMKPKGLEALRKFVQVLAEDDDES